MPSQNIKQQFELAKWFFILLIIYIYFNISHLQFILVFLIKKIEKSLFV